MTCWIRSLLVFGALLISPNFALHFCYGQFLGNRPVPNELERRVAEPTKLPLDFALNVITVSGGAEIRIPPTELRMVLASVTEAKSSNECLNASEERLLRLRSGWVTAGIAQEDIVEDFISILPVYEYEEGKMLKVDVLKEQLVRFRYQTNLHLKLRDDTQAKGALKVAFAEGVTDIISFDYWSPKLEDAKAEALQAALQAAKAKATILLSPELFEVKPKLINIDEETIVIYPKQMYESYVNTVNEQFAHAYRESTPRLLAPRPKTTFYRGPVLTGEGLSNQLPMRPEISVHAKATLYFESPGAKGREMPHREDRR